MNPPQKNGFVAQHGVHDAEDTLRLIAGLPAPQGLEERVKSALRAGSGGSRVLPWPAAGWPRQNWTQSPWARCAAAAAIVMVVAAGSWGVYPHGRAAQSPPKATALPRVPASGGFSSADAMRTPQTLQGPVVKLAPAARKPAAKITPQGKRSKAHVTTGHKAAAKHMADQTAR